MSAAPSALYALFQMDDSASWPDLPPFDGRGMLPPVIGCTAAGETITRVSPYPARWEGLTARFGHSATRAALLHHLQGFRAGLEGLGFFIHAQILGGSFVTAAPSPRDMDVVTFAHLPPDARSDADMVALMQRAPQYLTKPAIKAAFDLDAAFIFTPIAPMRLMALTSYWITLLSNCPGDTGHKGCVLLV